MDDFKRPGRIFIDNEFDEIYVADTGNNRILIFSTSGGYKYEFSVAGVCSTPKDIAISSDGFIYVLGSTKEGIRLFVFDFDGIYLREIRTFSEVSPEKPPVISSIAIDESNNLYLFDIPYARIIVLSPIDEVIREFKVFTDLSEQEKLEAVFGTISIYDNTLFIPNSVGGSIARYDLHGNALRNIGRKGQLLGELSFPVSASSVNDIIFVLDKHRYNIVCYSKEGKFLGEFGGKGSSPGWFYHPTWVAVDNFSQIYIGQIHQNKVQVCNISEFVKNRLKITLFNDDQLQSK